MLNIIGKKKLTILSSNFLFISACWEILHGFLLSVDFSQNLLSHTQKSGIPSVSISLDPDQA